MWNARSHVDSHVGEFIKAFCKLVHIPFQATQVGTYKTHIRMFFYEAVPGIDLIVVGGIFWMQIHVVLRMVLEIITVVVDGHLIEGKPAVLWLAQMRHYSFVLINDELYYRIKFWIVNHNKPTRRIFIHHANIFPKFDP